MRHGLDIGTTPGYKTVLGNLLLIRDSEGKGRVEGCMLLERKYALERNGRLVTVRVEG